MALPPYLKQKKQEGVITAYRQPDGSKVEGEPEADHKDGLKACAADLLKAIESKDLDGIASALYDAFCIADASPHEEGEHLEE